MEITENDLIHKYGKSMAKAFDWLREYHKKNPVKVGDTIVDANNLERAWRADDMVDYNLVLVSYQNDGGDTVRSSMPIVNALDANALYHSAIAHKLLGEIENAKNN